MSKFTPSPQEVALVNQIFTNADAQKIGVLNGEAAVKVFSGSQLPSTVLAEVWNLADEDQKGALTRKDVAVAIRLLGHAQRGERITEAHIHQPGQVPSIEGLNAPVSGQTSGVVPTTKSPPPGVASGLPPLTPQDKAKFQKLFAGCGPTNGLLPGEKARDVFVKSKLPVDKLSQIWTLADSKNRGALDAGDFTVAMYLIQASMSGQLAVIPQTLPPYLVEQAKPVVDGVVSHATGASGSFSPTSMGGFSGRPLSAIQPQYTGQTPLQPQTTGHRPTPPLPARTTSIPPFPTSPPPIPQVQWDITPAAKATSDQFFETLDTQKKGYIEGDVAVPFMVQSKLSDDILAQIWDLADLNNDGRLTREGFAVAMHLIQGKLTGKEVPNKLPQSLIPPSMRGRSQGASQPQVPEAIRDLLWDETPPPSATSSQPIAPAFPPPPTRAATISPQHTASQPTTSIFGGADPFASSSFTSPAPAVSPPPPIASPAHRDLLGDDDEPATTSSPPLQDKSAEIGNIQNQLHSTNRALNTASNERADLEKKLADQAAQLSALQTQLSSAKAAYETESRLLTTLRERYSTQNSDIQKARQELIRAESDLSAVRVEKAEVEGSLLRDKEEVRELQRKMTEVGSEVEMAKVEIEKAKKEAKQQKGLLAIAKKQLATRETERAKAQKELEEAQAEATAASKEREEAEVEAAKAAEPVAPVPIAPERVLSPGTEAAVAFAASQPLPGSPEPTILSPASPAMSTKSTNPFERLTAGSPPSQSPFLPFGAPAAIEPTATGESSVIPAIGGVSSDPFGFDDVFGGETQNQAAAAPKAASLDEEVEPTSATTTESSQPETSPFGVSEPSASVNEEDVVSPSETEHFMTPPSTATIPQMPHSKAEDEKAPAATEPTAEAKSAASPPITESYFPEISEISGKVPATDPAEDTDLTHSPKEIEVDDSDSDSDSDDEPLDYVKAKLHTDKEPVASSSQPAPAAPSSNSAFDDSFGFAGPSAGSAAPAAPAVVPPPAPAQVPTSPPSASLETPRASAIVTEPSKQSETPQTTPDTAAGVSDFDEALGKLSGSSQFSHVSQFTFDSAFDDDFDFAAAKAATSTSPTANGPPSALSTAQPPATATASGFDAVFLPPTSPPVTAPVLAPPAVGPPPSATSPPSGYSPAAFPPLPGQASGDPAQSRPFSFDDVFGTTAGAPTLAPQVAAATMPPANRPISISFDDAFGSDNLALDNSFASTISNSSVPGGPAPPAKASNTPFPMSAGDVPTSPVRATSPSTISHRSQSPPARTASPPPRLTSPRPRPSTSSSEKEKSTRHSKLSIRLPFGRKKTKQHDPMPSQLSQTHLSEEAFGNGATPAAEDDIDAVKTLCSMGFSRTQAVTALENHDYDVQRALNSLLGSR